MKRIGGIRRKTRSIFRKDRRTKGKISVSRFLQSFKIGEKVKLKIEPAIQKGAYHPMFHGRVGVIKGKRGRCYEIAINDGSKQKTLIVHPIHLKRI